MAETHSNNSRSSGSLRIFLSHSSEDIDAVHNLYYYLNNEGFKPWLDQEDLLPGQKWDVEIPKIVRASDVVVVCLSKNAITKEGYVQKEIKLALDVAEEKPEGTIFIIPLKLEECNVPDQLSKWNWVNFFEERGYERLMLALQLRANELGKYVSPVSPHSSIQSRQDKIFGEETWSARRVRHKPDEKLLMAEYFANHKFLVPEGISPETDARETVASIIVNQGTTPNVVVGEALRWIASNQNRELFHITWYTPSTLVPGTLRYHRQYYPHISAATQLFLFPGKVDNQTEAVSGPDAEAFVENLMRRFTYAFLSSYSFDFYSGTTYFHLPEEVRLQRACALRYATHKFLFLDSSKFNIQGEVGYRLDEMLNHATGVTIYSVTSDKDQWLKARFEALCDKLFNTGQKINLQIDNGNPDELDLKFLRLCIIGNRERPGEVLEQQGYTKNASA